MGIAGNCCGDRCRNRGALERGSSITCKNGLCKFILQKNGKPEILCGGAPVWSVNGPDNSAEKFVFQKDVNLVLYRNDNSVVWDAGIGGKGIWNAELVMQNDGNLVVYNSPNTFQTTTYNKCSARDTFWGFTFTELVITLVSGEAPIRGAT